MCSSPSPQPFTPPTTTPASYPPAPALAPGEGKDKSQTISSEQLTKIYEKFCEDYPVISIEDPFDQVRSPLDTLDPHLAP